MTDAAPTTRGLDPAALAELEEQRDFLLRSLDDLEREREAGDLDPDDYTHLRDDYTRRAAEVLRAIDEGRASAPASSRPTSWGRRLAVVGAVGALAVGAGFVAANSSGTRLPGETFTGSVEGTVSSDLQRAATAAQAGEVTEALRIYDEILADDPRHLEALSERGLLLASLGQGTERPAIIAEGRRSIERALEVAPDDPRALFYLGLALRLEGDREAGNAAFERALASDPPAALREQIENFLSFAGSGQGPPPGALPGSSPDGSAPPAADD